MKNKKGLSPATSDTFNLSISDLMAGLLAIFILILSWQILTYTNMKSDFADKSYERVALLNEIHKELNNRGIMVEINKTHDVLRLHDKALKFLPGRAKPEAGEENVQQISEVLYTVLNKDRGDKPKYKDLVETIFIEGHTDSDLPSFRSDYPDNWMLSTARAVRTWEMMSAFRPDGAAQSLGEIKNHNGFPIFSCSGYADTRRIVENETSKEEKSINRRIDIRFVMVPPKGDSSIKKEVKDLLSK